MGSMTAQWPEGKELAWKRVWRTIPLLREAVLSRTREEAMDALLATYPSWRLRHLLIVLCSYDATFLGAITLQCIEHHELAAIICKWAALDKAPNKVRQKDLFDAAQFDRLKATAPSRCARWRTPGTTTITRSLNAASSGS